MPNVPRPPRILVIDDEPLAGRAIRRGLAAWDVTLCLSAREALERFESGERFDAIVCDIMMPNMTGSALHRELLRLVPEQAERMLFVTGGALTDETQAFVAAHSDRVILKPFVIRELERRIRERLGH